MPILTRSRFNPARGGPAPTDVRGVFLETLKAVRAWNDGEPEPHVELRGRQVPASAVAGLLWNCSDFLPWSARDDLAAIGIELHQGATYAAAARELKGRFSEHW